MPTLYTYCMTHDAGSAPNPFWGVCTLVICKPKIRLSARVGDWVVGTGATRARVTERDARDMSGRVVYAMRVTGKMTMQEYDAFTRDHHPGKVPDWFHRDWRRRVGDSIYDFAAGSPKQRKSVHHEGDAQRDLSGKYALLSTDFYYFGERAVALPDYLRGIAQERQGYRSRLNAPHLDRFVAWLRGLGHEPGAIVGEPLFSRFRGSRKASQSSEATGCEQ